MDDYSLLSRRPSNDTMALAMCDPGLRRRHSSECEEDSLPEIYMDSGLSTLRGSHGGYDSEQEAKGQGEEEELEVEESHKKRGHDEHLVQETSDSEVRWAIRDTCPLRCSLVSCFTRLTVEIISTVSSQQQELDGLILHSY